MQFAIGVSLKHFGRCRSHGTGSVWDSCRKIAWVLKNSFQGISITKFVRKLLNVRSPQTLEFAEITALVPFSTPTPDFASCLAACFDRAISIANFEIGCGSQ